MSEHHRGAWGTREDAVWWPGAIATQDQQTLHHQHLINQHHQQQLAVQQQAQIQQHQVGQQQPQPQQGGGGGGGGGGAGQQQQQQQAHNEVARSQTSTSGGATQQLFSYKMASSFQNPATTMAGVTVATTNSGAYDYRLNMTPTAAPGAQWWYPTGQNMEQGMQHQANQHQQSNQHGQTVHGVHTPPPANQHLQDSHQQHQQNHQQNNQNNQHSQIQTTPARMPRGGKDAKPRGRMTAYAFFVQTCREEHKKKHPEESVIFAEFSRKCAERWKTMLDKEKKRFHEMAEKDKARYDLEMQNYVPPKGVVLGRGKKRKQIKDPNAPKRSLSAFFWFCNDERTKVKALNPEYGVGDIAKELGKKWSDVEPSTKSRYEAMADKDKKRYEVEMTDYKQRCKGIMPLVVAPPPPPPVVMQQHHHQDDDDDDDDGDDDDN